MIACDAFIQSHWVDVVIASPSTGEGSNPFFGGTGILPVI
jgi:hypothetical protein